MCYRALADTKLFRMSFERFANRNIFHLSVVIGEIANFAAYAFAPAILVTPLGALSIIIRQEDNLSLLLLLTQFDIHCVFTILWHVFRSAALAHVILGERLNIFGILGCVLCVVGSTTIVLHAPQEREIETVKEVWDLATEPGRQTLKDILFLLPCLIFF